MEMLELRRDSPSVVAQRITYEAIMKNGGVLKIDITEKMIDYVHRFSGEYKAALKTERSHQAEGERDVQRESD